MAAKKPTWMDDRKVDKCLKCGGAFGVFNRKHHCRACGRVFCNSCSSHTITLEKLVRYYGKDPVRVCDTCFYKERHENLKARRNQAAKQSKITAQAPTSPAARGGAQAQAAPSKPPAPTAAQQEQMRREAEQKQKQQLLAQQQQQLQAAFSGNAPAPLSTSGSGMFKSGPAGGAYDREAQFVSLPTSVRKDMRAKGVVEGIFGSEDPFAPKPKKPQPKRPLPQTTHNPPLGAGAGDIFDDIMGGSSTYTASGVSPAPAKAPAKAPAPAVVPAVAAAAAAPAVPSRSSQEIFHPPPSQPAPVAPKPVAAAPAKQPQPQPQTQQQPTATPAPKPQSPAPARVPVVEQPAPQAQPPAAAPVAAVPAAAPAPQAAAPAADSIESLPDPCSVDVLNIVPPRDGGLQETAKTRTMQEKAFVRWMNAYLMQRSLQVTSLEAEFRDGVAMIHLVECISGQPVTCAPCFAQPNSAEEAYRNFYAALLHLRSLNREMPPVQIQELVNGNVALMLNLLWSLLYRTEIEPKSFDGATGIGAILNWVKSVTSGYANVDILDFKKSFEDGLVFCAIVHKHNAALLDYSKLNTAPTMVNKVTNISMAFKCFEHGWNIPQLLDAEDVLQDPDDVCVIVFLAICFAMLQ